MNLGMLRRWNWLICSAQRAFPDLENQQSTGALHGWRRPANLCGGKSHCQVFRRLYGVEDDYWKSNTTPYIFISCCAVYVCIESGVQILYSYSYGAVLTVECQLGICTRTMRIWRHFNEDRNRLTSHWDSSSETQGIRSRCLSILQQFFIHSWWTFDSGWLA